MRDIIVVGGGLAGLAASIYAAQGGARVLLLERSAHLGGRAITNIRNGYHFNLGPHALYRGGCAAAALGDLGVNLSGGMPPLAGAFAYHGGQLHTFPSGGVSLLVTGLITAEGKQELAAFRKGLSHEDPEGLDFITADEWLQRSLKDDIARAIMRSLIRTATFVHAVDSYSAGAALRQLQLGGAGVLYLDYGWQSIVDGLVSRAQQAGVRLEPSRCVKRVEDAADRAAVQLDDGSRIEADAVIIATRPRPAVEMLGGPAGAMLGDPSSALGAWFANTRPARVACLNIGLREQPNGVHRLTFGIDRPLYLSVHSDVARLAPAGQAVVHVTKYLGDHASDPARDRAEMESLLDLAQPGWKDLVEAEEFLPGITVVDAVPAAAQGGLRGRPGPVLPDYQRVFVAGDWVGNEGQLADASLASAKQAAALALEAASVAARVSQTA
jgi:phytoene dehydrogenase-like protein